MLKGVKMMFEKVWKRKAESLRAAFFPFDLFKILDEGAWGNIAPPPSMTG